MVAEKQILAMHGIYVLPVLQSQFDCRKRRMRMKLIAEAVLLKEVQHLGYTYVICHLLMLFA